MLNDAHSIIVLTLSSGISKQFKKIGSSFKLASVSDTDGNFIQLEYSNAGLINKIISRNGGFIAIHRNESGRITSAEDDAGRVVTFNYDTQGRLERYSDLGGGQWIYGYDPQGHLASAVDPRGVAILNASYENEMATEVRILRDRMQFEYSGSNSTRVSNALQQQAVFWQHSSGLTESVQGFSGDMTGFSFDAELKPLSLHYNGVSIAEFSYDGAKLTRFDRTQAGENGTERYVYQHNKLAFIEQNGVAVARYTYDQLGRVAAASDGVGARRYQYHRDGRIRSITWDGQTYEIDTNPSGQIELITANGEQWIGINYNPSGSIARIDRRFNDANQPSQFQYDDRGFRTTTNFNGNDIEITYDAVGNLSTISYPTDQGRTVDQYQVGEYNELIQVTHGEKSEVNIEYDVVGRPINITKGSRILAVGYDQKGRVVDVTLNGSPFVNKSYDAMDSDAVLSSDKRTSYTTVPWPMVSSIFGSIDEIVYTRRRSTAHGPVRFDAQMAGFVLHTAPPVPDIVTLASLERRMLTPLGREFVPAPFKFDKPSNSLFLPPEFASVNCGICEAQTTFLGISLSTPLIAGQTERVYAHVGGGTCEFFGIQHQWEHRVTFGDGSSSTGTGSVASFNHTWNYPGIYIVTDSVSCSCWDPFAIPEDAYMVAGVVPPCPTQTQPADSKPPAATYPDSIGTDKFGNWKGGQTNIGFSTSGLKCKQVCPGKFRITGDIEIVHEPELTFVKVSAKLPASPNGWCPARYRSDAEKRKTLVHENKHASKHLATFNSYKSRIVGDYGSMDDCNVAKGVLKGEVQRAMYNQAVQQGNHVDHAGESRYRLYCPGEETETVSQTVERKCTDHPGFCPSDTY